MESLPKLAEYSCPKDLCEKCLTRAINAFRNSVFRPQLQSVAVLCIAHLLPHLPNDVIVGTVLPFALEAAADAANNAKLVVSAAQDNEKKEAKCRMPMQLIPSYIVEFDFFLSEGEPVIAICCLFRAIIRECKHVIHPQTIALEIIPNMLPHTLAKHWQFSEFKYLMSTLHELVDCLGELFPEGMDQTFPTEEDTNDCKNEKAPKRNICVLVDEIPADHSSPSEIEPKTPETESDTLTKTLSFTESSSGIQLLSTENRRIQRRGSGNVILPLLNTFSSTPTEPALSDENVFARQTPPETKNNFDSLESQTCPTSPLSQSNLLTVSVCEGPFGVSEVSRRRSSANDLHAYESAVSSSPQKGSKLNLPAGLPSSRKHSANALNLSQLFITNSRKSPR
ncbi:hypothetical protein SprV_0802510700 [Sparganum proliferum]